MKVKLLLLLTLFTFSTLIIFAQEEQTPPGEYEKVDETTFKINSTLDSEDGVAGERNAVPAVAFTDYLRVVLILVFVIIVLYFVLRFLKKVGGNRIGLDNDQINVLSTKVLKGNTALHLVEVGTQVFLIGATDSSVNGISEITDKESIDIIKLESSKDEGLTQSFVQMFSNKMKKKDSGNSVDQASSNPLNNINIDKEKLNKF